MISIDQIRTGKSYRGKARDGSEQVRKVKSITPRAYLDGAFSEVRYVVESASARHGGCYASHFARWAEGEVA